jgi:release factor glutamine methyltransferase
MTYSSFISDTLSKLSSLYPPEEGRAIAVRLLQHFCGISSYEHLVEPWGAISPEHVKDLEFAVGQIAAARPLQYVIGYQEFMGIKISVKEGVLIPRPETEELVSWVLSYSSSTATLRILDAACGSGCIATALMSKLPKAQIFACDLSPKALEVTARNLSSLHDSSSAPNSSSAPDTSSATNVFQYDLLKSPEGFPVGDLDIIVSNPPYVKESEKGQMRPNVLDYEPAEALFVPDHDPLLFYRALERLASAHLKPGGAIFMEVNENLAEETASIFEKAGYASVEIKRDIFGKTRMVLCQI